MNKINTIINEGIKANGCDYYDYLADNGIEIVPQSFDEFHELLGTITDESLGSNEAVMLSLCDIIIMLRRDGMN